MPAVAVVFAVVVVVLVDRLDLATARALQYARTLTPDDLRAVHFDIASQAARKLEEEWGRLGFSSIPLDIVECPDRRLSRAAIELVAEAVADAKIWLEQALVAGEALRVGAGAGPPNHFWELWGGP